MLQNILRLSSLELIQADKIFHRKLTNGIEGTYAVNNESRGDKYFLIDFENPVNNNFLVVNHRKQAEQIPRLILCVNSRKRKTEQGKLIDIIPHLIVYETTTKPLTQVNSNRK